jgi:DNA polymerase-4
MRAAHRLGRTVELRLRFGDYSHATRSATLPQASAHTATVAEAQRRLLDGAWPLIEARGLTLIGIAVSNLVEDRDVQLALPFDAGAGPALDAALDTVRDRFGTGAVTRAALLGRRQGQSVPLLPD